jgi:hypothetical protein
VADTDDATTGSRFRPAVPARGTGYGLKGCGIQSDHPEAVIRAVGAVVHESMKPAEAFEEFVRPAQHKAQRSG